MKNITLTLRQRHILNYLRNNDGYVTGSQLSKWLHVTPRSIRSDISALNYSLKDSNISIISKHSYGYKLQANNPEELRQLIQSSTSFIFKTDRILHIAMKLCTAEKPIDLYDLADEMFVSKTTLDSDLNTFKKTIENFSIQITINKNHISIENNERKKRRLLLHLYSQDWDYNHRSNIFYKNEFLDEKLISNCIKAILYQMDESDLYMEDVNLVHLILTIAISIYRMQNGYTLQEERLSNYIKEDAVNFTNKILDFITKQWGFQFPKAERIEMYELVSCSMIPKVNFELDNIPIMIPDTLIVQLTNEYLTAIKNKFSFDFFEDLDFYNTLLYFFHYLSLPCHNLNYDMVIRNSAPKNFSFETEIGYVVQPYAKKFLNRNLDELELIYLCTLISGALANLPPVKFKATILTHLNMPAAWNIRMKIEHEFPNNINIVHLYPIYMKDKFNFEDTDLILTTVRKEIMIDKKLDIIHISPYIDERDIHKIRKLIQQKKYEYICPQKLEPLPSYLKSAVWEEKAQDTCFNVLMKRVLSQLKQQNIISDEFYEDVLQREKIISFVNHPVFTLIHSSIPENKTHIHITTLDHRIKIQDNKIRIVIFLVLSKEDMGLLYKFKNEIYNADWNPNTVRFLKTKDEFISFFNSIE